MSRRSLENNIKAIEHAYKTQFKANTQTSIQKSLEEYLSQQQVEASASARPRPIEKPRVASKEEIQTEKNTQIAIQKSLEDLRQQQQQVEAIEREREIASASGRARARPIEKSRVASKEEIKTEKNTQIAIQKSLEDLRQQVGSREKESTRPRVARASASTRPIEKPKVARASASSSASARPTNVNNNNNSIMPFRESARPGPRSGTGASTSLLRDINILLNFLKTSETHSYNTIFEYNRIEILKIPLFTHYNSVGKYLGTLLQAWYFVFEGTRIYLVKNYMFKSDYEDNKPTNPRHKESEIEFRPNTIYMKKSVYVPGNHLHFFGKLEIVNLKTKKLTIKNNVLVFSHHGAFSNYDKTLKLYEDLEIDIRIDIYDVSNVDADNLYYVKFTPDRETITIPNPKDIKNIIKDFPVFTAFYWIKMTSNAAMHDVERDNVISIKKLITDTLTIKKGGKY